MGLLALTELLLATQVGPRVPTPLPYRKTMEPFWGWDLPGGVHLLPESCQVFLNEAPEGRLRVAVLGSSAVAGDGLTPFHSFPWLLQRRLMDRGLDVEVLNLAQSGADSAAHRRVLEHALEHFGIHLAIVYTGNNEFHRLRAYRYLNPRWNSGVETVRSALERLALYRWLQQLSPPRPTNPVGPEIGMGEIPVSVNRLDVALATAHYRANLEAMVAACQDRKVPLLLCTVAVNDLSAPNIGAPAPGELGPKSAEWARVLSASHPGLRQAVLRWSTNPYLLYEAGRLARKEGRLEEARQALVRSREFDPRPMRALPSFRQVVLDLARLPGAFPCDVEEALRERSRSGLLLATDARDPRPEGDDYFLDGCHPGVEGARQIAEILDQTLVRAGLVPPGTGGTRLAPAVSRDAEDLEQWSPNPDRNEHAILRGHRKVAFRHWDKAKPHYLKAISQAPENALLWRNLGRARLARQDIQGARQAYRRFLELGGSDPIIERELPLLDRVLAHPLPPRPERPHPPPIVEDPQPLHHRPVQEIR